MYHRHWACYSSIHYHPPDWLFASVGNGGMGLHNSSDEEGFFVLSILIQIFGLGSARTSMVRGLMASKQGERTVADYYGFRTVAGQSK